MHITLRCLTLLVALVTAAGCGVSATTGIAPTTTPVAPPPTTSPPPATTAAPSTATRPTRTPGSSMVSSGTAQLRVGETLTLAPQTTLTLRDVRDDSRCPRDVACSWQGAVDVFVEVVVNGHAAVEVTLRLYGMNVPSPEDTLVAETALVRLTALDPYPTQPEQQLAAYVATFDVAPRAAAPQAPLFVPLITEPITGFIVPAVGAPGFGELADGYWTPDAEDVRSFEGGVEQYLKQAAPSQSPMLWQKQAGYQRQYGGFMRDGRKLLYVSFFCNATGRDPQREIVHVEDGGDCFFQITYDPDASQYDTPHINGDS